jgi:hypothetical protein
MSVADIKNFNAETTADEVAVALKNSIAGKIGELLPSLAVCL